MSPKCTEKCRPVVASKPNSGNDDALRSLWGLLRIVEGRAGAESVSESARREMDASDSTILVRRSQLPRITVVLAEYAEYAECSTALAYAYCASCASASSPGFEFGAPRPVLAIPADDLLT